MWNEFWFTTGLVFVGAACVVVWASIQELFKRWLNNDWCKHDWGKWQDEQACQVRWCKNCNKMERRVP